MNKLIRVIKEWDTVNFILQTEGNEGFWIWQVSKAEITKYHGTLTEFVNDEANEATGTSEGSFDTIEEAIQGLQINASHRNLYTFFDEEQIDFPENDGDHILINGRKYKIYISLSNRVSDTECCRVRVDGKYYYFG